MIKKNIWIFIIIITTYSVNLSIGTPPVGIEDIGNGYLLGWNQGLIANETYYNKTSGLLQIANKLDRTKDITYIYGFLLNNSGTYTYIGTDSINSTINYASDFTSQYWANAHINKSFNGGDWIINKNNSQQLNDDLVNLLFFGNVNKSYTGDYYFVNGIRNLDIDQDSIAETIHAYLGNGSIETFQNFSGTAWRGNITRIVIASGTGTYSYDLRFPKGVIGIYNHTSASTNGDLNFFTRIGNINANQKYQTTQQWIDVSCTINCNFGASVIVSTNDSLRSVKARGGRAQTGCKYTVQKPLPIADCTFSADCRLQVDRNTSTGYTELTNTDTGQLRCTDSTCGLNPTGLTRNQYYTYNITGYNPGAEITQCSISGQYPSSGLVTWTVTTLTNQILWAPVDGNITANSAIQFRSNWTITAPDNQTLYLNGTKNVTQAGSFNFSQTVNFDQYGTWKWDVLTCKSHVCTWSWNGNFTLIRRPNLNVNCWTPGGPLAVPDWTNQTWAYFGANWTGTQPDNLTLYFSPFSGNTTIPGNLNTTVSGSSNLSVNFTNFQKKEPDGQAIYWNVNISKNGYMASCGESWYSWTTSIVRVQF